MKTTELSLYKKTIELTTLLYTMIKDVSRFGQVTIGELIIKQSVNLIKYISLANREKEKRELHLNNFLSDFESLKAELRILYENENNLKRHIKNISKLIIEIESEATKWKNYKNNNEVKINIDINQNLMNKN